MIFTKKHVWFNPDQMIYFSKCSESSKYFGIIEILITIYRKFQSAGKSILIYHDALCCKMLEKWSSLPWQDIVMDIWYNT